MVFLDMNPNGILDEESVSGVEQLDKLVISAYSMLGNPNILQTRNYMQQVEINISFS